MCTLKMRLSSRASEHARSLVVADAAVDDGLLAGVDHDERQLDGAVGGGRALARLQLAVALHQVLEGDLLQNELLQLLRLVTHSLLAQPLLELQQLNAKHLHKRINA